ATRYQEAVPFLVENGFSDVGVTASGAVVKQWQEKGGSVVLESKPVPIKHMIASTKMSDADIEKVRAVMLSLDKSEHGQKILAKLGYKGYETGDPQQLATLTKWLGHCQGENPPEKRRLRPPFLFVRYRTIGRECASVRHVSCCYLDGPRLVSDFAARKGGIPPLLSPPRHGPFRGRESDEEQACCARCGFPVFDRSCRTRARADSVQRRLSVRGLALHHGLGVGRRRARRSDLGRVQPREGSRYGSERRLRVPAQRRGRVREGRSSVGRPRRSGRARDHARQPLGDPACPGPENFPVPFFGAQREAA